MTISILGCVGASMASGVPIYRVRCSECGDTYRRTGWPWNIKQHKRCARCARTARVDLDKVDGTNERRATSLRKCRR